jgi:hypothetical protein
MIQQRTQIIVMILLLISSTATVIVGRRVQVYYEVNGKQFKGIRTDSAGAIWYSAPPEYFIERNNKQTP